MCRRAPRRGSVRKGTTLNMHAFVACGARRYFRLLLVGPNPEAANPRHICLSFWELYGERRRRPLLMFQGTAVLRRRPRGCGRAPAAPAHLPLPVASRPERGWLAGAGRAGPVCALACPPSNPSANPTAAPPPPLCQPHPSANPTPLPPPLQATFTSAMRRRCSHRRQPAYLQALPLPVHSWCRPAPPQARLRPSSSRQRAARPPARLQRRTRSRQPPRPRLPTKQCACPSGLAQVPARVAPPTLARLRIGAQTGRPLLRPQPKIPNRLSLCVTLATQAGSAVTRCHALLGARHVGTNRRSSIFSFPNQHMPRAQCWQQRGIPMPSPAAAATQRQPTNAPTPDPSGTCLFPCAEPPFSCFAWFPRPYDSPPVTLPPPPLSTPCITPLHLRASPPAPSCTL